MKEFYGGLVRPEDWEPRHPQEFVRGTPERQKGSQRPEQTDQFIGTDIYVNGVTADDL